MASTTGYTEERAASVSYFKLNILPLLFSESSLNYVCCMYKENITPNDVRKLRGFGDI